jgi:hypothetical protein
MPKFIMDTDLLAIELKALPTNERAGYLLAWVRELHMNIDKSCPIPDWAARISPKNIPVDVKDEHGDVLSDNPKSPYTPVFEEFWKLYPQSRRSGKGAAFKSWQKVQGSKQALLKACETALSWQKESRQWKEGYIPMPQTYLNQRRWEDDKAEDDNKTEGYRDSFGNWQSN